MLVAFLKAWKDRRGVAAMVFALSLPVLVGMAGIGVEIGEWYLLKRRSQTAADAGAFAGALQIAQNDSPHAKAAATQESSRNGFTQNETLTVTVNIPPLSGPQTGNAKAVEVIIADRRSFLFAALFRGGTQSIQSRAVATVTQTGSACFLALNTKADKALDVTGSSVVNLTDCSLASNSTSSQSIYFQGNTSVSATSAWSAGGITQGGSAMPIFSGGTLAYSWPILDPYASLTIQPTGTVYTDKTYSGVRYPGIYVGGITVKSGDTLILKPGTYYLDQGDFSVGSQATVTCACTNPTDGVTIVLTSTATKNVASSIGSVDINGQATVTLRAPSGPKSTQYPYPGVLFFQDRRSNGKTVNHLNGGANLNLDGVLYFPSSPVDWNGNSASNGCTQIISDTITISGNTAMSNAGCSALGIQPLSLTFSGLTE